MTAQSGITGTKELLDQILHNDDKSIIMSRVQETGGIAGLNRIELFQLLENIDDLYYFIKSFEDCAHQPLYILIPHGLVDPTSFSSSSSSLSSNDTIVYDFVTYVPDEAPIRNKMLYASSKLNLQRQIGNSKLNKNIMLTSLEELRHSSLINDLKDVDTEELMKQDQQEQEVYENLRKKQLAATSMVYANPNTSNASKLSFNIEDPQNYLDEFFSNAGQDSVATKKYLKLTIDTKNEIINVVQIENHVSDASEIASFIDEISYNIYRDGDEFYFIYACPSGSKVKDRMIYASSRQGCIKYLIHKYNSVLKSFVKVIEIGDSDDLDVSDFHTAKKNHTLEDADSGESTTTLNQSSTTRKFNRPKGPPNRRN